MLWADGKMGMELVDQGRLDRGTRCSFDMTLWRKARIYQELGIKSSVCIKCKSATSNKSDGDSHRWPGGGLEPSFVSTPRQIKVSTSNSIQATVCLVTQTVIIVLQGRLQEMEQVIGKPETRAAKEARVAHKRAFMDSERQTRP